MKFDFGLDWKELRRFDKLNSELNIFLVLSLLVFFCFWICSANKAKTINWEVNAFVEATPISGPARVGKM